MTAASIAHVGKESNRLEEVEAGLVHNADEVYNEYKDPQHAPWQQLVLPVLKRIPVRRLQEQTGMSPSQLKASRNGHAMPRAKNREALIRAAANFARERVRKAGEQLPRGDLEACAAYLDSGGLRKRERCADEDTVVAAPLASD